MSWLSGLLKFYLNFIFNHVHRSYGKFLYDFRNIENIHMNKIGFLEFWIYSNKSRKIFFSIFYYQLLSFCNYDFYYVKMMIIKFYHCYYCYYFSSYCLLSTKNNKTPLWENLQNLLKIILGFIITASVYCKTVNGWYSRRVTNFSDCYFTHPCYGTPLCTIFITFELL